jgi:integrase
VTTHRRPNGEGTIYRRKDGRWEGAAFVPTNIGTRKRLRIYGHTREEVHRQLIEEQAKAHRGTPTPARGWRLDAYLDYWLDEIVRRIRRPATYALYETTARLYLKPGLGTRPLTRLSLPMVQGFLNSRLEAGDSVSKVETMRKVLSSALTRALREELVMRNVAQLVTLPSRKRKEVSAWSADEARQFLQAAQDNQLYLAFLLLLVYGLRRGEVLGLRWSDIDFDVGVIRIRQQIQRIRGQLIIGPTKTHASHRELPLVDIARGPLMELHQQQASTLQPTQEAPPVHDLVFRTSTGQPIEPRNLVRSFEAICRHAGLRRIRVHDTRRTAATLLNKLGVPARDTQLILGHSRISITQEIYTDVDRESKTIALNRMQKLLALDR